MKVLVAIDSFKGSMSSLDAGQAAKCGILRAHKDAEVVVKPLADGGEGTCSALTEGLGGEFYTAEVRGPLGEPVTALYGILPDGKTAVMEMAQAAGITLVKREELNPHKASTYGVGQMIKAAMDKGCRNFIMGIGGSATSDGGTGMLTALGWEFLDKDGNPVEAGLDGLGNIADIRCESVDPRIRECSFTIACDVRNPLCGSEGAVYVYGPQKGVKAEDLEEMDLRMKAYGMAAGKFSGRDYGSCEGAGAAGGLGFAFLNFFEEDKRVLKPGIEMVMEAAAIEEEIKKCDIVVTGEGRIDGQTAMGKVPVGIAKMAKKYGKRVIAFAGGLADDALACNDAGIDAFFSIVKGPCSLEEAMDEENAKKNMSAAAEQVFRLLG